MADRKEEKWVKLLQEQTSRGWCIGQKTPWVEADAKGWGGGSEKDGPETTRKGQGRREVFVSSSSSGSSTSATPFFQV